jgi:hypothetical protein
MEPDLDFVRSLAARTDTSHLQDISDAFTAGADAQLKKCSKWLDDVALRRSLYLNGSDLRAAMRPEPSLKEEALAELNAWTEDRNGPGESIVCDDLHVATIRRALESIPDKS